MQALGKYQNLSCKISGMVTEADWKKWKKEDFRPYLDVVLETFGTNRAHVWKRLASLPCGSIVQ